MRTILEVQGLTKQYKDSDFRLNNISFSIPSGVIMGFVGENGSGKSTTIGCILNTLIKDSGTVKIFGRDMTDSSTDIRDDIGVVFDSSAFPVSLTPAKISSAMRHIYSKWDNTLFNEYLKKFKLPEKQKIKDFSRGMAMKLGVAVALSHHPKLLILDEATSSIDTRTEVLIQRAMKSIMKGRTSFVIAHRLSTIKDADLILVMKDGDIIEQGNHQRLLEIDGFYADLWGAGFESSTVIT